jgi:hypothetical protein
MSTYTTWQRRVNKAPKRVTWLCGTEKVLVEEVVDEVRASLGPKVEYYSLVGKMMADKLIWDIAFQHSIIPDTTKLIVVRHAEKLEDWGPLATFLANSRSLPNTYLVFVSEDASLYTEKDDYGNREWLPPAILKGNVKASTIECKKLKREDIIELIKARTKADDRTAKYLMMHSGGSLYEIVNLCKKVALFDGKLTEHLVDVLCAEFPIDDFITLLLSMKKPEAMIVSKNVPVEAYSDVFQEIDAKLDVLRQLNPLLGRTTPFREIAYEIKTSDALVRELFPIAKYYDKSRVQRYREVLAILDGYYHRGMTTNLLELLVSLW